MPAFNAVLGWVVNIGRSLPFIILLIALMPATQAIVGTSTGVRGVIPPLVVATAPFVARMVEQSLAEVSRDAVEAAEACGASVPRIVWSALLPDASEHRPWHRGDPDCRFGLYRHRRCRGRGRLGDIAIRYGYYRYENEVMIVHRCAACRSGAADPERVQLYRPPRRPPLGGTLGHRILTPTRRPPTPGVRPPRSG